MKRIIFKILHATSTAGLMSSSTISRVGEESFFTTRFDTSSSSSAAGDHHFVAFCHHVCHTTISCFGSSGGQYGSLGADFPAAGSYGVNRVAVNFFKDGSKACFSDDKNEGSIIHLISNFSSGDFFARTLQKNRLLG